MIYDNIYSNTALYITGFRQYISRQLGELKGLCRGGRVGQLRVGTSPRPSNLTQLVLP